MIKHILFVSAALVAATVPARAATVEFGVAMADNTSGAYRLRPDLSFSSGTGPITFVYNGLGDYTYKFATVNPLALGGNVQARAYASSARCAVVSWSNSGSDVSARIKCTAPSTGLAVETWTTIQYYAAGGTDPLETAYLWADQATAASYAPSPSWSYNSTGAANAVAHGVGVGEYLAILPGLTAAGGNPHVTAYGLTSSYCKLDGWFHGSLGLTGTFVAVRCFDATGAPADARWSLRYTNGHLADDGRYRGTYYQGDASFAPAVPAVHSYTPTLAWQSGGITNSVVDDSLVAYDQIAGFVFNVPTAALVTAVGHDSVYCNNVGLAIDGDLVHVDAVVKCFDASGGVTHSPYAHAIWEAALR